MNRAYPLVPRTHVPMALKKGGKEARVGAAARLLTPMLRSDKASELAPSPSGLEIPWVRLF